MDNQHRKIKGYRELSQAEIDLMNRIKTHGVALGELVEDLRSAREPYTQGEPETPLSCDQQWVAIGANQLQQGLMALTRSVARPDFF